ncbi:hypothetical protein ACXN5S_01950 [Pseudoroseicyclus sp. H15]
MKISAVVGVKDEAALLAVTIQVLLRAGVASVDILDDGSQDGTLAVAASLASSDSRVRLIDSLPSYENLLSMQGPLFGPILAREQPDRVLFTDADEAWLAQGPLSESAFLAAHELVSVPRYNAAPGPGGIEETGLDDEALRHLPLITARRHLEREELEADSSLRWVEHLLPPKVIADPKTVATLSMGGHRGVAREGRTLTSGTAPDVLIAHLPFTSYARFSRKIDNAAAMMEGVDEASLGKAGWHWRHWIALKRAGRLEEEFARQCYDAGDRAAALANGAFRTAEDILAGG